MIQHWPAKPTFLQLPLSCNYNSAIIHDLRQQFQAPSEESVKNCAGCCWIASKNISIHRKIWVHSYQFELAVYLLFGGHS